MVDVISVFRDHNIYFLVFEEFDQLAVGFIGSNEDLNSVFL